MGEVYRARDTRLDRDVAIKVLPVHLSSDPHLRARLEREAKSISQLSHPHVCALFDIGHDEGIDYLVMEYLEGETLADRIARGSLPLDVALRYGAEIAEALEEAHRRGVIHRDLKPGNVMITRSGAKVLDFGLARNADAAAPVVTELRTEQKPLTAEGTILGTMQYMAPEQLEGHEADARTDIFALGAVLYEMTTGRRAFDGKSRASLIASIMQHEPAPISSIQPMTPVAFDRVVRICLAKDPDDRWQSARDVALQLRWLAEGGSQAGIPAPVVAKRKHRERATWIALALASIAAIAFATLWMRERFREPPVIVSTLNPPDGIRFSPDESPAISPDGTHIALVGLGATDRRIHVRSLRSDADVPLAGTENAYGLFWSPDSKHIGFFAGESLKRVPAGGGPSQTLCSVNDARGGTWAADGTIVFSPDFREGLFKIASSGGTPVRLTKLDRARGENNHRFPLFLPDGKHIVFLAQRAEGGAPDDPSTFDVLSLADGKRKELLRANSSVLYANGYLLFYREGALVAQRFDAGDLKLEGDPVPVAADVAYSGAEKVAASVSKNGILLYVKGGNLRQTRLVWFDRSGHEIGQAGGLSAHVSPTISPDGTKIAFESNDATDDIWVLDLARGTQTRVTTDPGDESAPVWSPDGRRILYGSNRIPPSLRVARASGGGDEKVWEANVVFATDWSRDDEVLVSFLDSALKFEIAIFSMKDRRVQRIASSRFNESYARFSPDAKWIVYRSDESGEDNVYVLSRAMGERFLISTAGGHGGHWSRDGGEIYYIAPDRQLMAVPVKTAPSFEAGTPAALFSIAGDYDSATRDRFLVNVPAGGDRIVPATLVQNWLATIRDDGSSSR